MEEWVGERWHRLITRAADRSHARQAATLATMQRAASLLFHAAGGAAGVRVVPAAAARIGGPRDWLQRLAGSGRRAALPRLDGDTLALPPVIAVFDEPALNRDLYLWLAALAAVHTPGERWIAGNVAATERALERCPGFRPRWQRLLDAHLAQRPAPKSLRGAAAAAEAAVQRALRGERVADCDPAPAEVAPVWLWIEILPSAAATAGTQDMHPAAGAGRADGGAKRRRTRRVEHRPSRAPLLLASRAEALLTWSEHLPLDRATDDEDDGNATAAADDMEKLAIARDNTAPASRVKFDLDLPSASVDDLPLGPGEALPEWDWKAQRLRVDFCHATLLVARPGEPFQPSRALRTTARRVRRRLEVLRAAPRWQRRCTDGDDLDLDGWVDNAAEAGAGPRCSDPPVYARRAHVERSLATLLLADLSLSTDAYVNDHVRVIDVIRDALFVFGEALDGTGDAFAMLGFSSVRRNHVRIQLLKDFDEAWATATQTRVGAIKPGYYTRMGAAVRWATKRLARRPERQRLLLILTDGKPNDMDVYEGRWGIEDTRHAVHEARAAGVLPFCLSIDDEAHDYLPHLFGRQGWVHVHRPVQLPARLAAVYGRLTR
ncbi:MAG: VWA domain-containing protein [Burkholderiales bacterium]